MSRADFEPYYDKFGFIQPDRRDAGKDPSNNGIRFTAEAYILFALKGWANDGDADYLRKVFTQCEKEPGVFDRYPGCGFHNSHDDYISLLHVCNQYNIPEIPERIYQHGSNNNWNFDGNNLIRFPHLIAHAEFATGRQPASPLIAYMATVIELAIHADVNQDGNQDAKILSWHMARLGADKSKVIHHQFADLKDNIGPAGLGPIYTRYFGNGDHPLSKNFDVL